MRDGSWKGKDEPHGMDVKWMGRENESRGAADRPRLSFQNPSRRTRWGSRARERHVSAHTLPNLACGLAGPLFHQWGIPLAGLALGCDLHPLHALPSVHSTIEAPAGILGRRPPVEVDLQLPDLRFLDSGYRRMEEYGNE